MWTIKNCWLWRGWSPPFLQPANALQFSFHANEAQRLINKCSAYANVPPGHGILVVIFYRHCHVLQENTVNNPFAWVRITKKTYIPQSKHSILLKFFPDFSLLYLNKQGGSEGVPSGKKDGNVDSLCPLSVRSMAISFRTQQILMNYVF